jgi:hypothetical protein
MSEPIGFDIYAKDRASQVFDKLTTEPAKQTEYRIVFEASGTVAQGTATIEEEEES